MSFVLFEVPIPLYQKTNKSKHQRHGINIIITTYHSRSVYRILTHLRYHLAYRQVATQQKKKIRQRKLDI